MTLGHKGHGVQPGANCGTLAPGLPTEPSLSREAAPQAEGAQERDSEPGSQSLLALTTCVTPGIT